MGCRVFVGLVASWRLVSPLASVPAKKFRFAKRAGTDDLLAFRWGRLALSPFLVQMFLESHARTWHVAAGGRTRARWLAHARRGPTFQVVRYRQPCTILNSQRLANALTPVAGTDVGCNIPAQVLLIYPLALARAVMPATNKAETKDEEQARLTMERQAIYEHFLNRGSSGSAFDADMARLMEKAGVSVPDDDTNLRLRKNLCNLTNLGNTVEAEGATVLEQAVTWLDGLLKKASLEKDGPMLNLRLEIRTQCVLTHLMPPNVLGKAAARNGKKALEKQFPKRDSGGSKGAEAREALRYKLLDKARPTTAAPTTLPTTAAPTTLPTTLPTAAPAAAPAVARRRASCSPPGTTRRPPAATRPPHLPPCHLLPRHLPPCQLPGHPGVPREEGVGPQEDARPAQLRPHAQGPREPAAARQGGARAARAAPRRSPGC